MVYLDYALYAHDAYSRGNELENVGVLSDADGEVFLGSTIVDSRPDESSGFYAIAYDTGSEVVIAFRGTDSGFNDILNGWSGGAGLWDSRQIELAIDFYKSVKAQFPTHDITLTGHSLGGGLAGFVSSLTGEKALAFDNMTYELSAAATYLLARIGAEFPNFGAMDLNAAQVSAAIQSDLSEFGFSVVEHGDGSLGLDANISNFLDYAVNHGTISKALSYYDGGPNIATIPLASPKQLADVTQIAAKGEVLELLRTISGTQSGTTEVSPYFGGDERADWTDILDLVADGAKGFGKGIIKGAAGGPWAALISGVGNAALSVAVSHAEDEIKEAVQKHTMGLLAANLFLNELAAQGELSQTDKNDIAFLGGALMSNLFSDEVADAAGFSGGTEGASAHAMLNAIAYTATQSSDAPYGSSALLAIFDDARDAGRILNDASYNFNFGLTASDYEVRGALGSAIVQFGGLLAAKGYSDPVMEEGFIRTQGNNLISLDLSFAYWSEAAGGAIQNFRIVGEDALIDRFDYDDYFGTFDVANRDWLNANFGGDDTDLIGRLHFVASQPGNGISADLGAVDQAYQPNGSTMPSNGTLDVLATTSESDEVVASARNEFIDFGGGNDTVYVNGGTNLFRGGSGNDDTAWFNGNYNEYNISYGNIALNADVEIEHARGDATDGKSLFLNFELFRFKDAIYELVDPIFSNDQWNLVTTLPGNGNDTGGGGTDGGSGGDSSGDAGDNNDSGGNDGGQGDGSGENDMGDGSSGGNGGSGDSATRPNYRLEVVYPNDSGAVTEPDTGTVFSASVRVIREGGDLREETLYVSTVPGHSTGAFPAASAADGDYFGKIGPTESVVVFEQGQELGFASFIVRSDNKVEGIEAFRLMLRDDQVNTTSGSLAIQDVYIRDNEAQEPPSDSGDTGNGSGGDQGGGTDGSEGADGGLNSDPRIGISNGVEIRIVGVDASNPTPGGSAAVEIEVENTTSTTKLVGTLGVYFSEDDTPSRGELVGTYTPGTVNPGITEDRNVSFVVPNDASGDARIIVADQDELNDPDQTAIADFAVGSLSNQADLTFHEHYLSDNTLTFGQSVEVEYDVANIGASDSGRSDVSFYLSRGRTFEEDRDIFITNDFFGSNRGGVQTGIEAGGRDGEAETITITADMVQQLEGDLSPTNLYLLYVIDIDRDIPDADRSNNVVYSRFSIAAAEEDIIGYTDHVVTDFALSTDRITFGERYYFSATIENTGTIDADYPNQFADVIWRSVADDTEYVRGSLFTDDGGTLDSQYVRNEEYFATNNRVIAEGNLPVGEYDVFARTRFDDSEASDRLDNNESNAVRVFVGGPDDVPSGTPDPALRDLTVSQSADQREISVAFTVFNSGTGAYSDALFVKVVAVSVLGGDEVELAEFIIPGLAEQGDSIGGDVFRASDTEVALPSSLAIGQYDIVVQLDNPIGNVLTTNDRLVVANAVSIEAETPTNAVPEANADVLVLSQDDLVSVNVITGENGATADTDVDGDTLSIVAVRDSNGSVLSVGSSVTLPEGGQLSVAADGSLSFNPNSDFDSLAANQNTTIQLEYDVSDGTDIDTATIDLIFEGRNDVPVANDDAVMTDEDTAIDIAVLGNDSDIDGDDLSVASVSQGANGTVTINANGSVQYMPNNDFNGSDSFTYDLSDGNGGSTTATVTVSVTASNDAPDATDDGDFATGFGRQLQIAATALLGNDTDIDGDFLTLVSVGSAVNGSAELFLDEVIFTPAPGFSGTASFEYTVSDGNGGTDTAVATVAVGENSVPVGRADSYMVEEDGSLVVAAAGVLSNDTDANDDILSSTLLSDVSNGILALNTDGSFNYTPDANFNGSDSFRYTVSDVNGETNTATVEISVSPVNDAPQIADAAPVSVAENTTVVTDIDATDVDSNDLTFSISGGADASAFEIDADTGELSFIDAPDFETPTDDGSDNRYEVSVGVFDGLASADTFVFVDVKDEDEAANDEPELVSGGSSSQVVGSEADEIIKPNAGIFKTVIGGGGADVFDFSDTVANGTREFRTVLDYSPEDLVNLGSESVIHHVSGNNRVQLFVSSDFDVITLIGTESLSDIEFV